jgi:hypothetical protein
VVHKIVFHRHSFRVALLSVQIITPFASATASSVLQLYRHCQSAGQLLVFQQKRSQSVSKADLLADLTKMDSESDQLDKFARSL